MPARPESAGAAYGRALCPPESGSADHRAAARRLVHLCDRRLNPPEWVEWIDEPVPGYPKRPVPTADADLEQLKTRTLTNLYNQRPQWLTNAHNDLDAAVATAYGWPTDISNEDALRELLELNLALNSQE